MEGPFCKSEDGSTGLFRKIRLAAPHCCQALPAFIHLADGFSSKYQVIIPYPPGLRNEKP